MGKKKESKFLSSFGIAFELFMSIVEAVQDAGGSDKELDFLRRDPDRLKDIAKVVMGEFTSPVKLVAHVEYRQPSRDELMEDPRFSLQEQDSNHDFVFHRFGTCAKVSNEARAIEFVLVRVPVHYLEDVTDPQALQEIARRKLRPAMYEELLSFADSFKLDEGVTLMALGSYTQHPSDGALVAHIYNGKTVGCLESGGRRDSDTLFLAVRE